jgi:hypothetical protein
VPNAFIRVNNTWTACGKATNNDTRQKLHNRSLFFYW